MFVLQDRSHYYSLCQYILIYTLLVKVTCLRFLQTLRGNLQMTQLGQLYITLLWFNWIWHLCYVFCMNDLSLIILSFVMWPLSYLSSHCIVTVHFNHFYCMGICDKLTSHLSMLTYIYFNMDECWLTSFMP